MNRPQITEGACVQPGKINTRRAFASSMSNEPDFWQSGVDRDGDWVQNPVILQAVAVGDGVIFASEISNLPLEAGTMVILKNSPVQ